MVEGNDFCSKPFQGDAFLIAGIEGVEINGGRDGAVPSGDGQSVKQESVVFGNLMNGNGIITSKMLF